MGFSLFALLIVAYKFKMSESADMVPIKLGSWFIGNSPLYGYDVVQAAYGAALRQAKSLYPRVFQNFTQITHYQPGNFSCPEAGDETIVRSSEIYQKFVQEPPGSTRVLLSPGQ